MDSSTGGSGVGVLDKAALVLTALEAGPATLAGLVAGTGLARPTAHRLAVALEHHRLVARDMQGRFVLGPRLAELSAAAGEDRLLATAGPVLARLRDITGESAQLWRRQGDIRVCVAAAERPSGLRDTIPVGSQLTMRAGSAAQVLLAWEDPERMHRGLQNAAFSAAALSGIRRRGWAQSVGEREQGVASVSAPVRSPSGKIIAAVSVSGPLERLSRQPGRMHAPAVLAAAERLSESLRRAAAADSRLIPRRASASGLSPTSCRAPVRGDSPLSLARRSSLAGARSVCARGHGADRRAPRCARKDRVAALPPTSTRDPRAGRALTCLVRRERDGSAATRSFAGEARAPGDGSVAVATAPQRAPASDRRSRAQRASPRTGGPKLARGVRTERPARARAASACGRGRRRSR